MMAVIIAGSLLVGMMVRGKETRPVSRLLALAILLASLGTLPLMAFGGDDQIRKRTFKTIANGRTGISEAVDIGKSRGAPGDMFVFDQPLLDAGGKVIGANAGFCVRTTPGEYSVCQWTLAMANGSLTVAGREADHGTSLIPVIGGTGEFACATGVLATTPRGDKTYEQILTLYSRSDCAETGGINGKF